jgi:hypothetical protein
MKALADKYGEDIQLLQMPEKAAGKEKLSCEMVQEMWAKVLALPEQSWSDEGRWFFGHLARV